jgi:hypothetical protein
VALPGGGDEGEGGSGGESAGAIIGGVIAGVVVIVAMFAAIAYYLSRRRRTAGPRSGKGGQEAPPQSGMRETWDPRSLQHFTSIGSYPGGPPHVPSMGSQQGNRSLASIDTVETASYHAPMPVAAPGSFHGQGVPSRGSTPVYQPPPGMSQFGKGQKVPLQAAQAQLQNMFPQATCTYDDLMILSNGNTVGSSGSNVHPGSSHAAQGHPLRTNTSTSRASGELNIPVQPLPEGAGVEQRIARLHRQLDGMHAYQKPVMGRYAILGHAHRRQGGAHPCSHCMRGAPGPSVCFAALHAQGR